MKHTKCRDDKSIFIKAKAKEKQKKDANFSLLKLILFITRLPSTLTLYNKTKERELLK